jgi:hypothetical protein
VGQLFKESPMERANLEPAIKLIIVEIYNKLSEAARMPRRQRPVLKTGYLGQIIALRIDADHDAQRKIVELI